MYYSLICQMFIMYIQHFKKTNKENSKTIVYYLDEIKGQLLEMFGEKETILSHGNNGNIIISFKISFFKRL